jgi:putative hydrolase of the HAD superfamily
LEFGAWSFLVSLDPDALPDYDSRLVTNTNYQAVIFDLFHTLISLEVSKAPGLSTPEMLGIDKEEWNKVWMSDPDDYVLGGTDIAVPVGRIARQFKPDVTDEQIQAAVAARYGRFRHALLNIEAEALDGLRRLKKMGFGLGLISNCGEDEIKPWPESPLAPLFDAVLFSCEVKLKKPDRRIFELAAQRLGAAPGECLYVGNGGSDELCGARRAGMTAVLLTRHLEVVKPSRIAEVSGDADWQVRTVGDLADRLAIN